MRHSVLDWPVRKQLRIDTRKDWSDEWIKRAKSFVTRINKDKTSVQLRWY